jgi:hypothetical protein
MLIWFVWSRSPENILLLSIMNDKEIKVEIYMEHTLRERHFLLGCLTINDHHFHPTTTATASAIPAAVPPTAAGMEIAAACSVLVVGVAVLEFVEIVTSPIVLEVR